MTDKTEPALLIADALDCFTNEAMNAAINRQDLTAIAVADALSAGFGGLAHRLRENFTVAAPSGDEVERVAMALCQSALVGELCPCRKSGSFKCADEFPGMRAKAALAAIDRSDVERLRAALEWYGNMEYYRYQPECGCSSVEADGGEIARQALKGTTV